jgi:hypothetical protein
VPFLAIRGAYRSRCRDFELAVADEELEVSLQTTPYMSVILVISTSYTSFIMCKHEYKNECLPLEDYQNDSNTQLDDSEAQWEL